MSPAIFTAEHSAIVPKIKASGKLHRNVIQFDHRDAAGPIEKIELRQIRNITALHLIDFRRGRQINRQGR